MVYKGLRLDCGYRVDFIVADAVVVELKTVDHSAPVHEAQLLTYLRLGGWKVGLLINFNVKRVAILAVGPLDRRDADSLVHTDSAKACASARSM